MAKITDKEAFEIADKFVKKCHGEKVRLSNKAVRVKDGIVFRFVKETVSEDGFIIPGYVSPFVNTNDGTVSHFPMTNSKNRKSLREGTIITIE